MKKRIRLDFADFWPAFDKKHNYFVDVLSSSYDIEINDQPDFLIYSVFGTRYRSYECIRIFYTGECERPDFNECDYSFDFEFENRPNHYRLPHYALYGDPHCLLQKTGAHSPSLNRSGLKFCNFIYGNPRCTVRNDFFHKLGTYQHVDAAGSLFNNTGFVITSDRKVDFVRDYKFTIAFENQLHPGYTTEKLFQALQAQSLPIYWGNPLVGKDFNTRRFINCHEYSDLDSVVQRVIELDCDDDLYAEYMQQPCYPGNLVPDCVRPENVRKQFQKIFETPIVPVARRRRVRRLAWRLLGGFRRGWWRLAGLCRSQQPNS